jgi:hypothetical protein
MDTMQGDPDGYLMGHEAFLKGGTGGISVSGRREREGNDGGGSRPRHGSGRASEALTAPRRSATGPAADVTPLTSYR